jgi:hypothetical protein
MPGHPNWDKGFGLEIGKVALLDDREQVASGRVQAAANAAAC